MQARPCTGRTVDRQLMLKSLDAHCAGKERCSRSIEEGCSAEAAALGARSPADAAHKRLQHGRLPFQELQRSMSARSVSSIERQQHLLGADLCCTPAKSTVSALWYFDIIQLHLVPESNVHYVNWKSRGQDSRLVPMVQCMVAISIQAIGVMVRVLLVRCMDRNGGTALH